MKTEEPQNENLILYLRETRVDLNNGIFLVLLFQAPLKETSVVLQTKTGDTA